MAILRTPSFLKLAKDSEILKLLNLMVVDITPEYVIKYNLNVAVITGSIEGRSTIKRLKGTDYINLRAELKQE